MSGWRRTQRRAANRRGPLSADFRPEVVHYAEALAAKGLPDREVARAAFYAQEYGLEALSGDGSTCVTFAEPTCGDWNCCKPPHQVLDGAVR